MLKRKNRTIMRLILTCRWSCYSGRLVGWPSANVPWFSYLYTSIQHSSCMRSINGHLCVCVSMWCDCMLWFCLFVSCVTRSIFRAWAIYWPRQAIYLYLVHIQKTNDRNLNQYHASSLVASIWLRQHSRIICVLFVIFFLTWVSLFQHCRHWKCTNGKQ